MAIKAFRLELLPEDVVRLADALRKLVGQPGNLAAGLEGTTAYLAMDYYAAETLDVALRHLAPAPVDAALPILRGIADAIDAAWLAGPQFGHGTLHPRDVFVTPGTNALTVTGFGIAPSLEAIGARPPVRRPYTAPERTSGAAWDIRADVFSLGAIAHELLTGRRPAGPGEQDGSLPAPMPPEVRVRIRRVLSKALAESPARRFASAREFVDALANPASMITADATLPLLDASVDALSDTDSAANLAATVPAEEPTITAMPDEFTAPTPEAVAPVPPPAVAAPRPRPRVSATPPRVGRVPVERVEVVESAETVEPVGPSALLDSGAATTDLATSSYAPVIAVADIDDVPLHPARPARQIDPLPRATTYAPPPLPPPVPVAAMAAVLVAGLVLGAAIDHQFFLTRTTPPVAATPPPAPTPVVAAPAPAPTTTVPTDTEVAVPEPAPAPAKPVDRAAGKGRVQSTPPPKASTTGSVNVDSRPKGARVTIDGRATGTTPLSAAGLKPGVHSVRVELAGYKTITTTVTIKAGETARLAVTLEQR